ncbi:MAG TPA: thiamine-phosphate kinase [Roseiarcus sp.]|nr:thiamine-phosphate kinase [Roseiarcus sp.]
MNPRLLSPRLSPMPARPSEDDLIARFFAPLAAPEGLGLRDDAALLKPPAGELVLTKDALVAGVHFFADDPPGAIARKALRVNLSDLAAKGAEPIGFLIALALPGDWTEGWLAAFAAGLGEDAATYRCPLFGGDTVKTPGPLMVSITALGRTETGRMARRSGARAGDILYVSGTIGDGALGLALRLGAPTLAGGLDAESRAFLLERYLLPQPRVALTSAMRQFAHGGMDVSDGFVGDLTKLLTVSGVCGRIDLTRLPLSPAARAALALDAGLIETIATGGDDYEILAAVGKGEAAAFEQAARTAGVALSRIGEATEGDGAPQFLGPGGVALAFKQGSFSHF